MRVPLRVNDRLLRYRVSVRLALLAAVAAASLSISANADVLTLSFSPLSNVAAGSTGNGFDVLLTNTSGPPVAVDGFSFEVLSSSSDVAFTSATTATAATYIFGSDSLLGPNILGPGSTPQDLRASDLDGAGGISLASGATVGLGHVLFDVSATAPTQLVQFTYAAFPATSVADDLGNNIPISNLTAGQFEINSNVPEPSSLVPLLLTISVLLLGRRRLR